MQDLQFREKTYEKYFSAEIARITNIFFPPDQIDEHQLGFDDAFMLPAGWIAQNIIYRSRVKKARLTGLEISQLSQITQKLAAVMPKFRCNLFVQYKRPKFLESSGASKWIFWQKAYYEYKTEDHQQEALEKVSAQSAGRAQVVYAAPAFWQAEDLFKFSQSGAIISNSNIADVKNLSGHRKFTYANAGNIGRGHSESQELTSAGFYDMLSAGKSLDGRDFDIHMNHLSEVILGAVEKDLRILSIYNIAKQIDIARGISEDLLRADPLILAFFRAKWFSEAFQVQIYAYG